MIRNIFCGVILAAAVAASASPAKAETNGCAELVNRIADLLMIDESNHHDAEARVICAARKQNARAAAMTYLEHVAEHHADDKIELSGDAGHECADRLWTVAELLGLPDKVYKLGGVVRRCSGADNQPVQAAALMMADYRENSW